MTINIATPLTAKEMNGEARAALALDAIKQSKPITWLSEAYDVSRKFIHEQKNKAVNAINQLFTEPDDKGDDEKVLFTISVTKSWLKQVVLCLALHCRSSFRGIQKTIIDVMDYNLSLGTIFNYYNDGVSASQEINSKEDLSRIKLAAPDEMFVNNAPVLTGIDVKTLYCYLASTESSRDGETWAIKLMELKDKGFNPERMIADNGSGLRAGHEAEFPETPCDGDIFHIIKQLMEMRLFFRNRLKSSVTDRILVEKNPHKFTETDRQKILEKEIIICKLSSKIDTLVDWMRHDVLEKAGVNIKNRNQLYDFIVAELMALEKTHPHRIRDVRIALQNQKDQLLGFLEGLDKKFEPLAEKHNISVDTIWMVCELLRCKIGSDKYAIRSLPLQDMLGNQYDIVEDDVIVALTETARTSCMIENLHSRIRSYCWVKKVVNQKFLDLLRFYLNHTPFLRSEKETRVGKSPAELLFKKPHPHWLEMLGYTRFKRT